MDVNITQIIISVVTIIISIGGSAAAFIYNSGRQSKAIGELKSSVDRIDTKTDKLSDNVMNLSKEVSYLKGLFDAELLTKR